MSSSLVWRPVVKAKNKDLPCGLKHILRKRYGDPVNRTMCHEHDYDYLIALVDADIEGAQKLLDAIDRHGEIELEEVW